MSTSTKIAALEAAGKLWRFIPATRQPARRRLYLAEPAWNDLNDPRSACNILVGKGYLQAALTRWAAGNLVFGDKKRGRFLCRLDPPPPEIWEIRVTEPHVQARLLGRFAEPDTLVLTKFFTRSLLGDYGSSMWNAAMAQCEQTWRSLFDADAPFVGASIHEYVTENCDDFPI